MSVKDHIRTSTQPSNLVRFASINGHRQLGVGGPKSAMSGSPTISTLLQVARRRLRIEHRPVLVQAGRIIKEARAGVVYALGQRYHFIQIDPHFHRRENSNVPDAS